MDPLSITAAAVGITDFALSSIKNLHDIINGLTEAKDVVQDIAKDLEDIQRPLNALAGMKFPDKETYDEAKKDFQRYGVAEAVNHCGEACADFAKKLKQWTKHSGDGKFSLSDRFTVGVWNKEKIGTLRARVQSCRDTVHFAITGAQLFIQLCHKRESHADSEELKKKFQALEKAIEEHVEATKKQQEDAQNQIEELEKEPADEEDDGAQRSLAIQEVKERSLLLKADLNSAKLMSAQVRSRLQGRETGTAVTATFGDNNSGFQAGNINGAVSGLTFGKKE